VPGRPSVVAFVAAWCAPCHVELPELQELHEQLGDRATIVAVAVEEEPDATRGLIEETGVQFPVGLDEDGVVLMAADIVGLPGTILLDADGDVAHRFRGVVSGAEVEAELQPLLADV
jgi:thiol-disulfide isomerase/thioredoxin